jgi:hypothetical protein
MTTFSQGDRVRILNGTPEEQAMLFEVVEWNGDRGYIAPVEWSGRIRPQELVRATDIESDAVGGERKNTAP